MKILRTLLLAAVLGAVGACSLVAPKQTPAPTHGRLGAVGGLPVSALPAAVTPLSGTEIVPCDQPGSAAGVTSRCTAESIGLSGVALLGGDCTATQSGTITCARSLGQLFGTFAFQNYATPPVIGGTTPNSATFTNLTVTGTLTAPGFSGASGPLAPQTGQTFDEVMVNATVFEDILFGTSVSPGPGQVSVGNCSQLQAYFNWWQDSMIPPSWGDTPLGSNGENFNADWERFQQCNTTNFPFGPSSLNLTTVNEQASSYQVTLTTGTSGATIFTLPATIPIADLGLVSTQSFSGTANITGGTTLTVNTVTQGGLYYGNLVTVTGCPAGTSIINFPTGNATGAYTLSQACTNGTSLTVTSANALSLGQVVDTEFKGFSQITGITANTNVTLTALPGNSSTMQFDNAVAFMPQAVGTLNATLSQGATSATLTTPIPSNCQVGMMLSVVNSSGAPISNSTSRMTAINTSTGVVTFDNAWTYDATFNSGQMVMCMVPVTGAQLWTNKYFLPGASGARWYAFDLYASLPTDSAGGFNMFSATCTTQIISATTAATLIPPNAPVGEFSSFWAYNGNTPVAANGDLSEIDFMTLRNYPAAGLWVDNPGFFNSGKPPRIVSTATPFTSTCASSPTANVFYTGNPANIYVNAALAGTIRLSAIWTPTQVWLYINNTLMKVEEYSWSAQGWAQVGVQLPVGNFGSTGHNLSWPLNTTEWSSFVFQLNRLRILEQQ